MTGQVGLIPRTFIIFLSSIMAPFFTSQWSSLPSVCTPLLAALTMAPTVHFWATTSRMQSSRRRHQCTSPAQPLDNWDLQTTAYPFSWAVAFQAAAVLPLGTTTAAPAWQVSVPRAGRRCIALQQLPERGPSCVHAYLYAHGNTYLAIASKIK